MNDEQIRKDEKQKVINKIKYHLASRDIVYTNVNSEMTGNFIYIEDLDELLNDIEKDFI